MNDDNAIITALAGLLDTITDVSEVYEGIPNSTTSYPYIAIRPQSWSEEYEDLRDTNVTATYVITVYTSITGDTLTAQTSLRSIVKQIRTILNDQDNIALGGLIDYSMLTSGTYSFDQKDSSIYYCEIEYTIKKLSNRYS